MKSACERCGVDAISLLTLLFLVALAGCVRHAPPQAAKRTVAPAPAAPATPEHTDEPTSLPRDEGAASEGVAIAGRRIRISEPLPDEGNPVMEIVIETRGSPSTTIEIAIGAEHCERWPVALEPVEGASRLVLAQAFCEHGEDELSRDIVAAVVDVGDDAHAPKLLWEGTGRYRNSFDVCEHIDVPEVRGTGPGTAEVVRFTVVVSRPNPNRLGGGGCRAEAPRRRKLVELAY